MKKIKHIAISLLLLGTGMAQAQDDSATMSEDEKSSTLIQMPFATMEKDRVVGAVDVISGDDLRKTSEVYATPAMIGLSAGTYVFQGNGTPGSNTASLKVRGRSRGGSSDGPLVIIDGIANRSIANISLDAIESIQVLKDVTAKMLYGSKAADGVIVIRTKRGYDGKRKLSVTGDYGIKTPTFTPSYLNAAQYATKYNEALSNDGRDALYTPADIALYENQSSPLTHPDVDFNDLYLNESTDYERINVNLIGGDASTKYFVNFEYLHEDGLEKVGTRDYNQFRVNSNLDYQVTDVVSMRLDVSSKMDYIDASNVGTSTFFSDYLSKTRPNEYPIYVGTDSLGYNPNSGHKNFQGELEQNGYVSTVRFYAQTNFGMNFDLNQYVDGLSAGAYVTFDSYSSVATGKKLGYASYRWNDSIYVKEGEDVLKSDESRNGDDMTRNLGGIGNIDYVKSFGKNDLTANLVYTMQKKTYKAVLDGLKTKQDDKNLNLGLRVNYAYDNKYVAEVSSSLMGSDKFKKGNRLGLFSSAGLGWILSKEDFLADVDFVDYLKLKGTYGVMGYDPTFDYYLYRNEYAGGGAVYTGPKNTGQNVDYGQIISQLGNENLSFETSTEMNLGVEAYLMGGLSVEANYFSELREGMPVQATNAVPNYVSNVAPTLNYNAVANKGFDLALNYSGNVGDFNYSVGANMMYSKSTWDTYDELNIYAHQNREGGATDQILGFVADGLYADAAAVTSHNVISTFADSEIGLLPGDVKILENANTSDGIIDNFDKSFIGHSFPYMTYSANINLEYKGLSLYVLGQGVNDVDKMLSGSYYYNTGINKYSSQVMSSTQPRLTSYSSGHSYRGSSYWMRNGAYFKIRTLQLKYSLPESIAKKAFASGIDVYVKGDDVLSFSKIKDVDPENTNAGITTYPMYSTYSVGVKLTF